MAATSVPTGILLGQIITGQWPVPRKAVDAYLAWQQRKMSYVAMAEIVSNCMVEIIGPLVESDDPNLINFRTGLALGFFDRIAEGVRAATGSPITGEEIKNRVFSELVRRPPQSMNFQQAAP
jgi:hypothetical protein